MREGRSDTKRRRGHHARENAGMSSESHARNVAVESPRFPGEGSSTQGKSGPKARAIAVADGQRVMIPAPPRNDAVTRKDIPGMVMVSHVQIARVRGSEVRRSKA